MHSAANEDTDLDPRRVAIAVMVPAVQILASVDSKLRKLQVGHIVLPAAVQKRLLRVA